MGVSWEPQPLHQEYRALCVEIRRNLGQGLPFLSRPHRLYNEYARCALPLVDLCVWLCVVVDVGLQGGMYRLCMRGLCEYRLDYKNTAANITQNA